MGKSIQFYQNADPCPKSIKSNSEIDNSRNTFKWSDITSNPGRKAMIISVFLTSLYGLCGISAILNYLKLVFDKTGSTISPKTSTLVIGIILVIGNLTVNSLVDCTGRKVTFFEYHQFDSNMVKHKRMCDFLFRFYILYPQLD